MAEEIRQPKKSFDDYFSLIMQIVAICMSVFQICTAFIGALPTMEQRSAHLGFALILVFMQSFLKDKNVVKRIISSAFIIVSLVSVQL